MVTIIFLHTRITAEQPNLYKRVFAALWAHRNAQTQHEAVQICKSVSLHAYTINVYVCFHVFLAAATHFH